MSYDYTDYLMDHYAEKEYQLRDSIEDLDNILLKALSIIESLTFTNSKIKKIVKTLEEICWYPESLSDMEKLDLDTGEIDELYFELLELIEKAKVLKLCNEEKENLLKGLMDMIISIKEFVSINFLVFTGEELNLLIKPPNPALEDNRILLN